MNWKFWKKKEKVEKELFPCKNCLVNQCCNKVCDKLIMNDDELMQEFLKYNKCPDCGSDKFMEGPSGGAAVNVKCSGCGHWFNFGLPLFIQRIRVKDSGEIF